MYVAHLRTFRMTCSRGEMRVAQVLHGWLACFAGRMWQNRIYMEVVVVFWWAHIRKPMEYASALTLTITLLPQSHKPMEDARANK